MSEPFQISGGIVAEITCDCILPAGGNCEEKKIPIGNGHSCEPADTNPCSGPDGAGCQKSTYIVGGGGSLPNGGAVVIKADDLTE